jgi:hypothetical protein
MEEFQAKLVPTKRGDPPTSEAGLKVVSRSCARSCEARESTLVNVLVFVNNRFPIGDLHFTELKIRSLCSSGDILYVCMNFVEYLDM